MNMMANALLDAGIVTKNDVEKAQTVKREEQKIDQELHERALRLDRAMSQMPIGIAREMAEWMEEHMMIPIEVLEKWANMAKPTKFAPEAVANIKREWCKWLNAFQESKHAVN